MTDEMIQFGKTLAKTITVMVVAQLISRQVNNWLDNDKKNIEEQ